MPTQSFQLFQGFVPGDRTHTGYLCDITVLENDPLYWWVMAYFPGDPTTKVLTIKFPVKEGEELQAATSRINELVMQLRVHYITTELYNALTEEEESIEESSHVIH